MDIRERVVGYVASGGSKASAARRYNVSRKTIYNWLRRDDLLPKRHGSRYRKLDKAALRAYVKAHPHALLREMAEQFDVALSSLSRCLAKMGIVKKQQAVPEARQYEKSCLSWRASSADPRVRL